MAAQRRWRSTWAAAGAVAIVGMVTIAGVGVGSGAAWAGPGSEKAGGSTAQTSDETGAGRTDKTNADKAKTDKSKADANKTDKADADKNDKNKTATDKTDKAMADADKTGKSRTDTSKKDTAASATPDTSTKASQASDGTSAPKATRTKATAVGARIGAAGNPGIQSAPDAPTITSIVERNGSVRVYFDPPVSPTEPNPLYTLFQRSPPGGGSYYYTPGTGCVPTTNGCTRTGLTNGQTYEFSIRVYYLNAETSAWSDPVSATPHPVAPDPPTITSVVPGNQTLTVNWTAPSDTGGASLTGYTASISPVVGAGDCPSSPALVLTCTFTGLTNGDPYTVSVIAHNSVGPSTADTENGTPYAPPNPPVLDSANVSGTTITANWTPGSTNGTPATGFTVDITKTAGPGASTLSCSQAGNACTATGERGATYDVKVRATSAAGPSNWSNVISAAVPALAPAAPTINTPTIVGTTVTVTWSPNADNGSTITSYTVEVTRTNGTDNPAPTCTPVGVATTCDFTGARAGTYDVRVRATNGIGPSPWSGTESVTVPTQATAPTAVSALPFDNAIHVSWTMANTTNVAGFSVVATRVTGSSGVTSASCTGIATDPTARSCRIGGLLNANTYSVRVTSLAAPGSDTAYTDMAGTIQPVALPLTGPVVTPLDHALKIDWTYPEGAENRITGFVVSVAISGTPAGTCSPAPAAATRTCTIGSLTNAQAYDVSVRAVAATGNASDNVTVSGTGTPVATPPTAPGGVAVVPADGAAAVTWTPSTGEGITKYVATATPEPGVAIAYPTCEALGASATTCTITPLTNGVTYTVKVIAVGLGGNSAESTGVLVTPAAPPALPVTEPTPAAIDGTMSSSEGTRFVAGDQNTVITGTNFAPNTWVTVGIYSTATPLGTARTNAAGTFSLAVAIPQSFTGTHTIVSMGVAADGSVRILALDVRIAAAGGGAGLADTGAPIAAMALFGLALVGAGALLRAGPALAARGGRRRTA